MKSGARYWVLGVMTCILGSCARAADDETGIALRHRVYPLPESWLLERLGYRDPMEAGVLVPDADEDKRKRRTARERLAAFRVTEGRFEGWFDVSRLMRGYFGTAVPPNGGWAMWNEREQSLSVSLRSEDVDLYDVFFGTGEDRRAPWMIVVNFTLVAWSPADAALSTVLESPLTVDELQELGGDDLEEVERLALRVHSGQRAKISSSDTTIEGEAIVYLENRYVDVSLYYERETKTEVFELSTALSIHAGGRIMVELGYGGKPESARMYFLVIGAEVMPANEKAAGQGDVKTTQ